MMIECLPIADMRAGDAFAFTTATAWYEVHVIRVDCDLSMVETVILGSRIPGACHAFLFHGIVGCNVNVELGQPVEFMPAAREEDSRPLRYETTDLVTAIEIERRGPPTS